MKDKEWSGLEKLPDELLIKTLRTELGKQNAYIIELEDTVKIERTNQHDLFLKKNDQIAELKAGIEKLQLVSKDQLNRIVDLTKRNELLHKQLMQLLKQTHH
jgi:hypothetical protein